MSDGEKADGKVDRCELCEAGRFTPWDPEEGVCGVAECEACSMPIVVWNRHGPVPPDDQLNHMLARLNEVAVGLFGANGYAVDRVMRQIPAHFHAHARIRRTTLGA